jgi:heat shock protein HtpX
MSINVYDEIAANERRTIIILLAFPVALFMTFFLLFLLLANTNILPFYEFGIRETGVLSKSFALTIKVYPWTILVVFIWIVFSYYNGSSMILQMSSARPVTFEENRELYRLVENTAIMTGLPTPKIYLIEDESLNAFATGRNPDTSSIALTSGIVEKLDKAELQTGIAHELAHINNHDTRLMLIKIAGIGCFLFLGELLFRIAFRSGRRRSGKNSGKGVLFLVVIGIVCFVFGYLVAPVLRFALSRRREYQADAVAVKITRDPDALVRALYKIAEDPRVEVLDSSPLVGNMCIASPAKIGLISSLYLTHPPIEDRIAVLNKMLVKGKLLH